MAKGKANVKDLKGYFFLAIGDGTVNTIYETNNDPVGLAAAFATAMAEDKDLFDLISTAFITLIDQKEKYSSKKSNKLHKPVKKAANKK